MSSPLRCTINWWKSLYSMECPERFILDVDNRWIFSESAGMSCSFQEKSLYCAFDWFCTLIINCLKTKKWVRTPLPCTRIHDRVPLDSSTQVDGENCQLPVSFWISKIGQLLREIWPKTSQKTKKTLNSGSFLNNGPICNPKPPLESWEALLFGQTVQIRVPLI